jgi:hypothetical protein
MEERIRYLQERITFFRKVLCEIELLSQRYTRRIAEAEEELRGLEEAGAAEDRTINMAHNRTRTL